MEKHAALSKIGTWINVPLEAWLIAVLFLVISVLTGCSSPPPPMPEFVIKAGSVIIPGDEFARELELKLTAYPYDIKTNSNEYNSVVLDLAATLADEAAMLNAARKKGIEVSLQELEHAEDVFKKDYPGNSFEQMLLDNVLEYSVWQSRFKKNMIISKLIQKDLVDAQQITPGDMVEFYSRQDSSKVVDASGWVEQLRLEKSQAAYDSWIQNLKKAETPEINKEALAKFLIN